MDTCISASDKIFEIINVSSITDLLDGAIYKGEPLSESFYQFRNISITTLPTDNDFINTHVVNINIYVPDLRSGQADEDTLNSITAEILSVLKDYYSEDEYYDITIVGNAIVRDENKRSYMNIRIEVLTD